MQRAALWPRMMAHNIDLIVLLPIYYLFGSFIADNLLLGIICLTTTVLYDAGFACSNWQGTPGKKVMKLQVTTDTGKPITCQKSIWRTTAKLLTPLTLFIGYIMISFTPDRKGLHDYLAGTTVFFQKDV